MRAGALATLGFILGSQAAGTPPDAGGIMAQSDSSFVVYWVHPGVNCYEQGYDNNSESAWLVGGEDPGVYAAAVNIVAPFASYVKSILIRISPVDQFGNLPGDQFSPFALAIYEGNPDRAPTGEPLYSGSGRLCGGDPCEDEWFRQSLLLPHLTAIPLWQVFYWADSTPFAPQLNARVRHASDPTALMGFDNGGGFVWTNLNTLPVFRERLSGVIPLDTVVSEGWRHRVAGENRPDSFLISCFSDDNTAKEISISNSDTLMCRLADAEFDSLKIRSYYGGITDDSALTILLDVARWPRISADIVFPDSKSDPSIASLHITNLGADAIDLRLGYNNGSIVFATDTVELSGHESIMIPGVITQPPEDTTELIIIVADRDEQYYPLMVTSTYPQSGQTDANGSEEEGIPGACRLVNVYPNPCFKSVNIVAENARGLQGASIFNVIGQKIMDLPLSGTHLTWDGCDRDGRTVPPGIYFVRIKFDDAYLTRAVLLMR